MSQCLHLGHAGAGSTGRTNARTEIGTGSTGGQEGEDQRGGVAGPGEPEEGRASLGLTAALLRVDGAVGDGVVEGVVLQIIDD